MQQKCSPRPHLLAAGGLPAPVLHPSGRRTAGGGAAQGGACIASTHLLAAHDGACYAARYGPVLPQWARPPTSSSTAASARRTCRWCCRAAEPALRPSKASLRAKKSRSSAPALAPCYEPGPRAGAARHLGLEGGEPRQDVRLALAGQLALGLVLRLAPLPVRQQRRVLQQHLRARARAVARSAAGLGLGLRTRGRMRPRVSGAGCGSGAAAAARAHSP